jgi:DNA modification methylase
MTSGLHRLPPNQTGGTKEYEAHRGQDRGNFCHCGAWRGDLGLEPTPELFIQHLVEVFREVKRVMRKDATLWLNLGDSYASTAPGTRNGSGTGLHAKPGQISYRPDYRGGDIKPKDLMMLPAQLALALRADGWWLRSEIVWAKKAPMPESCTDRPTCAHEKVFLLTKSARYFYDADAVKEEASEATLQWAKYPRYTSDAETKRDTRTGKPDFLQQEGNGRNATRNMRNVWHLGPEPFPEAHFATFVTEIPRRAILAGTSARGVCPKCGAPWVRQMNKRFVPQGDVSLERGVKGAPGQKPTYAGTWDSVPRGSNDVETIGWRPSCKCDLIITDPAAVLDPFLGSGTTALVADQLGRDCIGIELSPKYAAMAERRLRDDAGMFASIAAE